MVIHYDEMVLSTYINMPFILYHIDDIFGFNL